MKILSSSILLARVHGMEIRFHFSLLFSVPIAYYLFKPADLREYTVAGLWLAGFVFFILLHELGHAFTAQLLNVEVKSVVVWLLGGFTNLSRKAEKPLHNLAISAAGPLVNMLLAFICIVFYVIFYLRVPNAGTLQSILWGQSLSNLFFSLALVNLILIVFNLLPIYPLDGGSILHSLAEFLFGRSSANWITLLIGIPILLCLFAVGVYLGDYLLIFSCLMIALALGTLNASWLRALNLGVNYLFKRGGYYYLKGDYERAVQYFTDQIEKEPSQPNHYLARAGCLLNMLQITRAHADVDRALNLVPSHPLALQMRGELFMFEKDYERAGQIFLRVLDSHPNWGIPHFDLGSLFLEKKQFQIALGHFNKSIMLLPQHSLFYLVRSIAHFYLNDLSASHRDQDFALALSESDSLVMTEINQALYEDRLAWAEDFYARILAGNPGLGYAWQGRADAHRVNGFHDDAVCHYTRAMEMLPKEARLYIGRGKSYIALDENEKAKTDFQTALYLTENTHLKRQAEDLLQKLEMK